MPLVAAINSYTFPSSRAQARDLTYTPRSRKLDRLVNNGLVRSLGPSRTGVVCAARDDSISLLANSFGVASQKVVAGIADPGASTFAFPPKSRNIPSGI